MKTTLPAARVPLSPRAGGGARGAARSNTMALALILAVAILMVAIAASLALGARSIPLGTVWESLWHADAGNEEHGIVRELRLGRTVIGLTVGAALAVAGALAQSLTRNPLADPGLLGLNAGAALAIVLGSVVGGVQSAAPLVALALIGAAVAGALVYGVGGGGGSATPVRLALAGAAVTALFSAVTSAIVLGDQTILNQLRYWLAGSLTGRSGLHVAPFVIATIVLLALAALAARPLAAVALGDDAAVSLGVRVGPTRAAVMALVVALAAVSTALAGPIAFVGLAVPHLVRSITGARVAWLLALSAPVGAAVVLLADVAGRLVARPGEISVGIATALGGGIVVALLARRMRAVAL